MQHSGSSSDLDLERRVADLPEPPHPRHDNARVGLLFLLVLIAVLILTWLVGRTRSTPLADPPAEIIVRPLH